MSKIRGGYPSQASGFPFSEEQIDALLGNAFECALNRRRGTVGPSA
jgi:hypothetical protein